MEEVTACYITEETVYLVTTNSDLTEGRGGIVRIGWFADGDVAASAARGQGVMGTDAHVEPRTVRVVTVSDRRFVVGDEVCLQFEDPVEVRARALSKLTSAERRVLGLETK